MEDFSAFVASWNDPAHPDNLSSVMLNMTPFGNINSTGVVGNYDGHALSKWHPQFDEALESGVRELVLLCVHKLGWITYTSCEGHRYLGRRLKCTERHVGLAPASKHQECEIATRMNHCAQVVNERFAPIRIQVVQEQLNSDGILYPVVDIFFRRRRLVPWTLYFRRIDNFYARFVAEVRRL